MRLNITQNISFLIFVPKIEFTLLVSNMRNLNCSNGQKWDFLSETFKHCVRICYFYELKVHKREARERDTSSSHNKAKFVKPNFQGREKPSRNYVNKNTTTISMMSVAPSQYWSQALSKCNAVVCYRNIMAPSLKNWTNEHCNVCRKKESAFYILPPSLLLEERAASCSLLLEEPWDSEKIMPFISSSYDGSARRSSGSSTSGLRGLDRFSSTRKSSVYERPSTYNSATAATTNNTAASKYSSLERIGSSSRKNGSEDSSSSVLPSRFSTISTSTPTSYKDSSSTSTPFGISSRRDSSTSSYLRYWSLRLAHEL